MNLNINTFEMCTDFPECITAEEIRCATQEDDHLNILTTYIISGWPPTRAEVKAEIQPYWPFQDGIAVMYGITMKGRRTRHLNIHQAVSLSYNHLRSGQAEACMKFIKCSMKNFWY